MPGELAPDPRSNYDHPDVVEGEIVDDQQSFAQHPYSWGNPMPHSPNTPYSEGDYTPGQGENLNDFSSDSHPTPNDTQAAPLQPNQLQPTSGPHPDTVFPPRVYRDNSEPTFTYKTIKETVAGMTEDPAGVAAANYLGKNLAYSKHHAQDIGRKTKSPEAPGKARHGLMGPLGAIAIGNALSQLPGLSGLGRRLKDGQWRKRKPGKTGGRYGGEGPHDYRG